LEASGAELALDLRRRRFKVFPTWNTLDS